MFDPQVIEKMINDGMDCISVTVTGDGHHFDAVVVSDEFIGESTLARHRRVYATLGSKMGHEIHALSIRALTPETTH
jgi:acid stress-induced BolA-like protein IbaG/YrbA